MRAGQEAALVQRMQAEVGMPFTYPALETQEGDLVTETPAICSLLTAVGSAPHLGGADVHEQAQVDQWMSFMR